MVREFMPTRSPVSLFSTEGHSCCLWGEEALSCALDEFMQPLEGNRKLLAADSPSELPLNSSCLSASHTCISNPQIPFEYALCFLTQSHGTSTLTLVQWVFEGQATSWSFPKSLQKAF